MHNHKIMYPEYFGGRDINEHGNLVMLITYAGSDSSLYNMAVSNSIETRMVQFSYVELNFVFDQIEEYMENNWQDPENIIMPNLFSIGLDTMGNSVEVNLFDVSPQSIYEFQTLVLAHDALNFVHMVPVPGNYFMRATSIYQRDQYAQFQPLVVILPLVVLAVFAVLVILKRWVQAFKVF